MESQPQNPEFRNNPENFNPCTCNHTSWQLLVAISHSFVNNLSVHLIISFFMF